MHCAQHTLAAHNGQKQPKDIIYPFWCHLGCYLRCGSWIFQHLLLLLLLLPWMTLQPRSCLMMQLEAVIISLVEENFTGKILVFDKNKIFHIFFIGVVKGVYGGSRKKNYAIWANGFAILF